MVHLYAEDTSLRVSWMARASVPECRWEPSLELAFRRLTRRAVSEVVA